MFLLSCIISVNSQNQSNSKSITYNFENLQNKKIDSTINLYKTSQKKIWLNLIPSLNYDLNNNAFSVGFSLNSLASFYQQKQRNKIQLAQFENQLKIKLDNEVFILKNKIEEFKYQYEILKNKINIFKIDSDLYQISKGKYQNSEIPTEQFFNLKKAYLTKINTLKNEYFKLKLSANKIKEKTLNNSVLDTLSVLHNNLKSYENKEIFYSNGHKNLRDFKGAKPLNKKSSAN